MWAPEHRTACDRRGLRYPSDLTDAERALIAPLIPPAKRGGRPRTVNVRDVLWTGCQWTALPKDLPPRSTIYGCYYYAARYRAVRAVLAVPAQGRSAGRCAHHQHPRCSGQRACPSGTVGTGGTASRITAVCHNSWHVDQVSRRRSRTRLGRRLRSGFA